MSQNSTPVVSIAGQPVGSGAPAFIIAEAGVNHNGDVERAEQLVDAAASAGADAVKFQTFRAEQLVTPSASKVSCQLEATDAWESQYDMLRRLELSREAHAMLLARCRTRSVIFLSTPFDEESADLLESLEVPAFKLPSGELTNGPLLQHIARKGRPMIVSTGMATLDEVSQAVQTIREAGDPPLILLHCVSRYPVQPAEANLRAMQTMAEAFGVPVGYSDHTLGIEVALAAVALGACVIEKHLTLNRSLPGPDHQASLEPTEFQALVQGIRRVETALGHGRKEPARTETEIAAMVRRSLVAARDIPAGVAIEAKHITLKRPGTGLPPSALPQVVGRHAKRAIAADTVLSWELLE